MNSVFRPPSPSVPVSTTSREEEKGQKMADDNYRQLAKALEKLDEARQGLRITIDDLAELAFESQLLKVELAVALQTASSTDELIIQLRRSVNKALLNF